MKTLLSVLIAAVVNGGLVSAKVALIAVCLVLAVAYMSTRNQGPASGLASF